MAARFAYWSVRLLLELIFAYLIVAGLAVGLGDRPGDALFLTVALPIALIFWAERWKRWLGCLPLFLTLLGYLFLLMMAGAVYAPVNPLYILYSLLPFAAFLLGRSMRRKQPK